MTEDRKPLDIETNNTDEKTPIADSKLPLDLDITEQSGAETTINLPPQESKFCMFDKAKDEKYKKIFAYASVPFFLGGAILAMFKTKGDVRNPYSFLIIIIALMLFSIPYVLRYFSLKKCACSVCNEQRKVTLQFLLMFTVLILVFVGVFIYLMVA